MTELKSFLAGIYDALSEAEMAAIAHGQTRRAELRDRGVIPRNMAIPVYHASNVEVTLDVGLTAEETEDGTQVFIEETAADDASSLTFSVELFELIEEEDLGEIDYEEILDVRTGLDLPTTELTEPTSPTETESGEESTNDDENGEGDERDGEIAGEDDVEVVDGIGPTYGERLRVEGIETTADLSNRSAAELANLVSTESHTVSPERTASWLGAIGSLDGEAEEPDEDHEEDEDEGGESNHSDDEADDRESDVDELSETTDVEWDELARDPDDTTGDLT